MPLLHRVITAANNNNYEGDDNSDGDNYNVDDTQMMIGKDRDSSFVDS